MDLNRQISVAAKAFRDKLKDKTQAEKSFFHYHSVLNLSKRIVLYRGSKAETQKTHLLDYFAELNSKNYQVNSKLECSRFHNQFLLSIEQYLIKKDKLITKGDLHILIIIGIVLDVALYFLISGYYFPIAILVLS